MTSRGIVWVLVVALVACGKSDPDPPPPSGISGFIVRDGSGLALAATGGSGTVAGATIELLAQGVSTKSRSDGAFALETPEPGSYVLRVTAAGEEPREFPITTFLGADVRVGDRAFPRVDSIASAEGVLAGVNLAEAFVYSPPTPLPAGVIVTAALGDQIEPFEPITLAAESWFFYVDPTPDERFHHAVHYIFIDVETGALSEAVAGSWPLVNGRHYYAPPAELGEVADALRRPDMAMARRHVDLTPPPAIDAGPIAAHVPGCTESKLYVLAIAGSDEHPMNVDLASIDQLYGKGPFPGSVVRRVHSAKDGDPNLRDTVVASFDELCAMTTECDTILVFATAHGSENGGLQIGTDRVDNGVDADFDLLSPGHLDFSKCRACHNYVMLDSCYAGRWIDQLAPKLQALFGREAAILAASARNRKSASFSWYHPLRPSGGYFTQTFLQMFPLASYDVDLAFGMTRDQIAMTTTSTAISNMNPQIWRRVRQAGETCVFPYCGDGTVQSGETCDDGNNDANDGCSPSCTVETGYTCDAAQPTVCTRDQKPEYTAETTTLGATRIAAADVPSTSMIDLTTVMGLYGYNITIAPGQTIRVCVTTNSPTAITYYPRYSPGYTFLDGAAGCTDITNIDGLRTNEVLVKLDGDATNATVNASLP